MALDVPEIEETFDSVVDELRRPKELEDSLELSVALASAVLVLACWELWDVELRLSDVAFDETLPMLLPPLVALVNSVIFSSSNS